MVCFHPLPAYRALAVNSKTGKRGLVFKSTLALREGDRTTVPCGGCIGCRVDRAEGWAIRCVHEAHMHEYVYAGCAGSSFLTLTFAPEHLPSDNSVRKRVLQDFVRKLRRELGASTKIRYLGCGEYGERFGRAHYHILVFGFNFPDRKLYKVAERGYRYYTSDLLDRVWSKGLAVLADVTYESGRYVGGYITKRIGGDRAEAHYTRVSPVDGVVYRVDPEFALVSRMPGLGEAFFHRYKSDLFPSGFAIVSGRRRKVPRYYEKLLPEPELEALKRERKRVAAGKAADRTKARLAVRKEVFVRRISSYVSESGL